MAPTRPADTLPAGRQLLQQPRCRRRCSRLAVTGVTGCSVPPGLSKGKGCLENVWCFWKRFSDTASANNLTATSPLIKTSLLGHLVHYIFLFFLFLSTVFLDNVFCHLLLIFRSQSYTCHRCSSCSLVSDNTAHSWISANS